MTPLLSMYVMVQFISILVKYCNMFEIIILIDTSDNPCQKCGWVWLN